MYKENLNELIVKNILQNNKELFEILADVDFPKKEQRELTERLFQELKPEILKSINNKAFDWKKDKIILPVTQLAINYKRQKRSKRCYII